MAQLTDGICDRPDLDARQRQRGQFSFGAKQEQLLHESIRPPA